MEQHAHETYMARVYQRWLAASRSERSAIVSSLPLRQAQALLDCIVKNDTALLRKRVKRRGQPRNTKPRSSSE